MCVCVWVVDHQNMFGVDESVGPVALSLRREKVPESGTGRWDSAAGWLYQYRIIVRTSEVCTTHIHLLTC